MHFLICNYSKILVCKKYVEMNIVKVDVFFLHLFDYVLSFENISV